MQTLAEQASDYIAFDYGTRRIGVAVGNELLQTARPLGVVLNHNGTPEWNAIKSHLQQWQPAGLIIGLPLNEAGEEQALCNHVRGFARQLAKRFSLPVHLSDERYSSLAAQEEIRKMRQSGQRPRRSKHADIDGVAAALILEQWFSQPRE